MEEERRLAYVGITRAMRRLTVTYAKRRWLYGTTLYNPPSCFLSEIPEELLDVVGNGWTGGRRQSRQRHPNSDWHRNSDSGRHASRERFTGRDISTGHGRSPSQGGRGGRAGRRAAMESSGRAGRGRGQAAAAAGAGIRGLRVGGRCAAPSAGAMESSSRSADPGTRRRPRCTSRPQARSGCCCLGHPWRRSEHSGSEYSA